VLHVVVLSDTHLRAGSKRRLPDAVYRELDAADAVLHAGDIVHESVLADLARFAPVHAVLGNNDVGMERALAPELQLDLDGVRVAMVHDSGPRAGRERRMRRRFPDADVVVFGHSHIPWNERGEDGQLLFNPGSATERRRQPKHTFGILDLDGGVVRGHEIRTIEAP
jgi:putative phosphoesterase